MAWSEGPDSSCSYVLQTPLFALSILTGAVFLAWEEEWFEYKSAV